MASIDRFARALLFHLQAHCANAATAVAYRRDAVHSSDFPWRFMGAAVVTDFHCRPGAVLLLALLLACLAAPAASAEDSLQHARQLLEASGTARHFQSLTRLQARAIIRHYEVIVASSTDHRLPGEIRAAISECYRQVYDWDNFKHGIARILASKLSPLQLQLLTDFYSSRGLPPQHIDTFKASIALADEIEAASAAYMFANSQSCVEHDARLIHAYLRNRSRGAE